MSAQETSDQNLSWAQLCILIAVANGYGSERSIRRAVRMPANIIRRQIQELSSEGLIEREGRVLGGWRVAERGIDVLGSVGFQPDVPRRGIETPLWRNETRIAITFGTAFKATLGAVLGVFAGITVVGAIASLVYWTGYTLVVKDHIPPQLLPYIPLDNPVVDVLLGLITSVALFTRLQNRLNLSLLRR